MKYVTNKVIHFVIILLSILSSNAQAWSNCNAAPNHCETGGQYCYTAGAGSCSNRCSSDCPVGGTYTFTGVEFCPVSGSCGPLHSYCQCLLQSQTNPNCDSMYGDLFLGDGTNCNVKCGSYCKILAGGCVQEGGEPRACLSNGQLVCACGAPNIFGSFMKPKLDRH